MPHNRVTSCALALLLAQALPAGQATRWHVAAGGRGDGTAARPFGRVADALDVAGPGDEVLIGPGMYREAVRTTRGGRNGAPLVIRASSPGARPTFMVSGRVATIAHPDVVIDGLILDGAYGPDDAVRVTSAAARLVLRDIEVRHSGRDCVDMGAPGDVLIERARIHHCLDATGGRRDAHGIVAGAVERLTVRDSEIHTFSGDALQFDPGRSEPGWTGVRLERLKLWLEPLPAGANGFAAGVVPGENGIDTKTPRAGRRSQLTAVDIEAWGFRGGLIANMAAFNIKERVDATLDGITVSDSEIAFRLRGPASTGATATLRNIVVHHVGTAVRYEDDIQQLRVHHMTVGRDVRLPFRRASSPATVPDVRNLLVLGTTLPIEARGRGLAVPADSFSDAGRDDYRLSTGSQARGAGDYIEGVITDRRGVARPRTSAVDLGAYQWCAACEPRARTTHRP